MSERSTRQVSLIPRKDAIAIIEHPSTQRTVSLGVEAHDIFLIELDFKGVTSDQVISATVRRSKDCQLADTTPLRVACLQKCPRRKALRTDPYPVTPDAPPDSDSKERYSKCYAFGDRCHLRSVEEVK